MSTPPRAELVQGVGIFPSAEAAMLSLTPGAAETFADMPLDHGTEELSDAVAQARRFQHAAHEIARIRAIKDGAWAEPYDYHASNEGDSIRVTPANADSVIELVRTQHGLVKQLIEVEGAIL